MNTISRNSKTTWKHVSAGVVVLTLIWSTFVSPARAAVLGNHLDASFSGDGKTTRRVGGNMGGATDVAVQPDGKIVVVGSIGSTPKDFLVARYNSDGGIDSTFGGEGGSVITDFGGGDDRPHAVAIQADGKIVVAGSTVLSGFSSRFALARYNTDGSPDLSFAGAGQSITTFPDHASIRDLAIQADGKIVAAGSVLNSNQTVFALTRYNSNGLLDPTFSDDGRVVTVTAGYANALAIQPDGKIVAAGGIGVFEVARYNPNGSLDPGFGSAGRVSTAIGNSANGYGVALQTDGKIVATGTSVLNNESRFAITRYMANGTLDLTFDNDGQFIFMPDPTLQGERGRDVVIQPDGKILTIGKSFSDTVVIRVNPNGRVDDSFGNAGVIRTDFGSDVVEQPLAIALAPNNKLVVSAQTELSGEPGFGVARYSTNLSVPKPAADFDGDGVSDLAVFRPANGAWYIHHSYTNTFSVFSFGLSGDVPIDGDFNGDDRNDYAVFRPSSGVWYITYTSSNQSTAMQFGTAGDRPVPGDYDHDAKTDAAVWRPSDGNYYVLRSSDGQASVMHWGVNGDIPIGAAQ